MVAVPALLLAGCTSTNLARRAHYARVDLAGLSRAELEACAGPPMRTEHSGNWEYLYYASPLRPDQKRSTQCIAIFLMRRGYVEDLNYENAGGRLIGEELSECLVIVDPCLPKQAKD